MPFPNLRAASRSDFGPTGPDCIFDQVNAGSLQRIADATELMANNHRELIAENERLKRYHDAARLKAFQLQRRLSALRGVVTKQRNKIAALQAQ